MNKQLALKSHVQLSQSFRPLLPFTKKDMVDYNNQTIRIGSATLESAFNGDRGIELGTLIAYSMLVKCL